MFQLIEDRNKAEINWWTVPAFIFTIFSCGMGAGILIGRRSADLLEWAQLALMLLLAWRVFSPLLREIRGRLELTNSHGH
jgi:hypothetical protein